MRLLGSGIAPGNQEYGVTLFAHPVDHGVLLAQIKDIEFVDKGRYEKQRRFIDFFTGGGILDELENLVFKYDLARRVGEILANLEGIGIGHAHA